MKIMHKLFQVGFTMVLGMAKEKICGMADRPLKERIEILANLIVASKRLVVFTGAGISTDSGLPDYRGPEGVWTRKDKGLPPPKWKVHPDEVRPNASHMEIGRAHV
jgi:hypothetical protein